MLELRASGLLGLIVATSNDGAAAADDCAANGIEAISARQIPPGHSSRSQMAAVR